MVRSYQTNPGIIGPLAFIKCALLNLACKKIAWFIKPQASMLCRNLEKSTHFHSKHCTA
jgi:hypothetical protein